MIDSHCHLDFEVFDKDRGQVLASCQKLGIEALMLPGVKASSWQRQLQIVQGATNLYAALGLHPYFLDSFQQSDLTLLHTLLTEYRPLAVGEIGLDFAIEVDQQLQERVFIQQLELAREFDLPVIIHHRRSHNELLRLLKQHPPEKGGVIHAFSGSMQIAQSYIQLGFKLGVGGIITYERAKKTNSVFKQVALEHLLLETDAPDMPLNGYQGQRNTPERLPLILQRLAELRQETPEVISTETSRNFRALFLA